MPRQVRIEYEGAIYHCLARGDQREPIVVDDSDRTQFVRLLKELMDKTGWKLFAWVLIDNHYHLAFQTPEPNLVAGMQWLQNTWTKRFNARHGLWGHLFGDRYKTILVEEGDYLAGLIHYIHLNPVRAGLVWIESGLDAYGWSSLSDYVGHRRKRRPWVAVGEGLQAVGFRDTAADRRAYLAHLESMAHQDRKEAGWTVPEGNDLHRTLRRGWCYGSEAFQERILDQFGHLINTKESGPRKRADGFTGNEGKKHGEALAEQVVRVGLEMLKLREEDLKGLKKAISGKLCSLERFANERPFEWPGSPSACRWESSAESVIPHVFWPSKSAKTER